MTFRVTARSAELFSGLVAPRVEPGAESSGSEWMRFLRDRVREKHTDATQVSTVYVPDPHGTVNAVVAVSVDSPGDVAVGDVFVSVPTGVFAVFVPSGTLADPIEDVWAQVDECVMSGSIFRAYKEEVEVVTNTGEVELFISIVL
ncbi:effector binding domain-containing protein [Rhodococcus sp. 14-2483-1-2]|uniref:effector binding domain-containing protein n=1 Tax=Rhodococcus sp. 14-2483-1-2 TaxID=2023147 RepID=UPI000B9A5D30|nr:effector binding domain-containing protein [Rhodococcus sp. 14-2483-1-2]OZF39089.1 AraC family transcriptional regulator [Rhodococcus sp. 14-2483-1-2]